MFPTLVLAWTAPGETEDQAELLDRLRRRLRKWNLELSSALFNPTQEKVENVLGNAPSYRQLVLTWIEVQMEIPSWLFEVSAVRKMSGLHICSFRKNPIEKFSISMADRRLHNLLDRRRYWFAEGWWVSPYAPYGMKRVEVPLSDPNVRPTRDNCRFNLIAGDAQQIEVVRLIFDLYSYRKQSVMDIVNLLRAEKISAGECAKDWNNITVERVLTDPIYIGAYRYKTFVRYEAFPAVIEPWLYYVALARLYSRRKLNLRDRSVSLIGRSEDPVVE